MLLNYVKLRADLAAVPGEHVALTKAQVEELARRAEVGDQAVRALSSIRAQAVFAASACGAPS